MHKTQYPRAALRLPVKNNGPNKLIFTPIRISNTNSVSLVLEDMHDKQALGRYSTLQNFPYQISIYCGFGRVSAAVTL
jgi:hypothetical protein